MLITVILNTQSGAKRHQRLLRASRGAVFRGSETIHDDSNDFKEAQMTKKFLLSMSIAATCTIFPNLALAINSNATDVHVKSASDPGYKAAMLSNKAMSAIQKNDWQEARNCLEEAVKLDPNEASCMVHTNLGLVLEHFKEFDQAGEHLQKALAISPEDKSALEDMGSYYQQTGDLKQAVVYFQKYLKLYPDAWMQRQSKG
ncbi:unnamed protein product [Sphagnum balticum]